MITIKFCNGGPLFPDMFIAQVKDGRGKTAKRVGFTITGDDDDEVDGYEAFLMPIPNRSIATHRLPPPIVAKAMRLTAAWLERGQRIDIDPG